jgi:hypothetical protein
MSATRGVKAMISITKESCTPMTHDHRLNRAERDAAAARAALALGETLVLALAESGVVSRRQLEGTLRDAISAHDDAAARGSGVDAEIDAAAAALIRRILEGARLAERR